MLLRELADTLESEGHTVGFVAARQEYRASQRAAGRLIREFKALAMMLRDGMMQPRADLIISASSPPCLVVVAALLTLRHRARSIHWVMDLYPEIAVALGEVSGGPFVSIIQWIMGWCYRSCAAVVALDEDMKERFEKYGVVPQIIR
ncbi:MAG: glycosyltransferase, partial [Verrucomicrobiota bacterium]